MSVFTYLGSSAIASPEFSVLSMFPVPLAFISLSAASKLITKMWLQYKNLIQLEILLPQIQRDGLDSRRTKFIYHWSAANSYRTDSRFFYSCSYYFRKINSSASVWKPKLNNIVDHERTLTSFIK